MTGTIFAIFSNIPPDIQFGAGHTPKIQQSTQALAFFLYSKKAEKYNYLSSLAVD
jgi:hypothetical protein